MKRLHAVVSGRVQGVGFRDFVQRAATSRGLRGYVRNGDDGRSVEVCAEGDEPSLEALIQSLREGPRFARVERVSCDYSDATGGFSTFSLEF